MLGITGGQFQHSLPFFLISCTNLSLACEQNASMGRPIIDVPDILLLHCLERRSGHRRQLDYIPPSRRASLFENEDDYSG